MSGKVTSKIGTVLTVAVGTGRPSRRVGIAVSIHAALVLVHAKHVHHVLRMTCLVTSVRKAGRSGCAHIGRMCLMRVHSARVVST